MQFEKYLIQAVEILDAKIDEPFILVDPESGVSLSVMTTAIFMYRLAFSDGDFGTASAVSWLLFLIIALLTWGNSRLFGRSEGQHAA